MAGPLGIFTGAGISAGPPASLPLGDEFHERLLRGCHEAARRIAPDAVSDSGIRLLITSGRRNILGCLEDCLEAGTTADVLNCMRVRIPTEAHMLCALHAARGAGNITLNFDNGIELAYALLSGVAELPADAPTPYQGALVEWRRLMPPAAPLRVVSTPTQLIRRRYTPGEPVLIKLRGSVNVGADSTVIPLRPAFEDLESVRLDEDRLAALTHIASSDHFLVTGHSGRDLDCFESLCPLLRRGSFSWVVPEITAAVDRRLRAVDPAQPQLGTAEQALRVGLPTVPAWPRLTWRDDAYAERFNAWWARIPPMTAAHAYAWMLADAGRYREPLAVLRALSRTQDSVGVRLRIADVLTMRGCPGEFGEAERIFAEAAAGAPPDLRGYLSTRQVESRVAARPETLPTELVRTVAAAGAAGWAGDGRAAIRSMVILGRIVQRGIDALVLSTGSGTMSTAEVIGLVRSALTLLQEAMRHAETIGTGARQTDLELEIAGLETQLSLFGEAPLPADLIRRLSAVERAYTHRGNAVGGLHVLAVRALARLATGRRAEFAAAVAEIGHRGKDEEYAKIADALVARLTHWQSLVQPSAQDRLSA